MSSQADRAQLSRALDTAIHLAAIAAIVLGSFWVFRPFAIVVIWAVVIAVAFQPLYDRLARLLGSRRKLASGVFVTLVLAAILVPAALLGDSLLDAARDFRQQAEAGELMVPPPPERVKDWPVIGERAYAVWHDASLDLADTARKMQPQLRSLAQKAASGVSGLGRSLVQTVLAIIIAGILMMNASGGAETARRIARKLAGENGPGMVALSVGTIRNVVKGVVLVALIQGLLAAGGLVVAGVPFSGVWTLAVMVLAVAQLPPLLVLGPIVPWVFANNDSTLVAVSFTIWSVLVSFSDPFLKMLLLGRGVAVPMLVILIGAIGGMLRAGMIGLFVGPVVLAIFYQLFNAWVRGEEAPRA